MRSNCFKGVYEMIRRSPILSSDYMPIWILFRYLYRKARILTMTMNHKPKVNTKIKGISLLNNFEILYDCVIARKAYQVGIGKP